MMISRGILPVSSDIVKTLLETGADPYKKNNKGKTALEIAKSTRFRAALIGFIIISPIGAYILFNAYSGAVEALENYDVYRQIKIKSNNRMKNKNNRNAQKLCQHKNKYNCFYLSLIFISFAPVAITSFKNVSKTHVMLKTQIKRVSIPKCWILFDTLNIKSIF